MIVHITPATDIASETRSSHDAYWFMKVTALVLVFLLAALVVGHLFLLIAYGEKEGDTLKVDKVVAQSDSTATKSPGERPSAPSNKGDSLGSLGIGGRLRAIGRQETFATVFIAIAGLLVGIIAVFTTILTARYHREIEEAKRDIEKRFRDRLEDLEEKYIDLDARMVQAGTNLRELPKRVRNRLDTFYKHIDRLPVMRDPMLRQVVLNLNRVWFEEAWVLEYLTTFLTSGNIKERRAAVDFLERRGDRMVMKVFAHEEARLTQKRTLEAEERRLLSAVSSALVSMRKGNAGH